MAHDDERKRDKIVLSRIKFRAWAVAVLRAVLPVAYTRPAGVTRISVQRPRGLMVSELAS